MKILIVDMECVLKNTRYPLKDGFENLGHRVDMFDWSYYFPRHTNSSFGAKASSRLFEGLYINKINEHFCSMVTKIRYNLILIVMGKYIKPETIEYAKDKCDCIVNWNSDDIFNTHSSSEFVINAVSKYDAHFTPRPHLVSEYKIHGAKEVIPIDWYYRPGFIKNSTDNQLDYYSYEFSFIGSWSKYREAMLDSLSGDRLDVFGWGWGKNSKLNRNKVHAPVSLMEMHEIFTKTAININLLTIENRDVSNLRNYEIPAVMGFQLAERSNVVSDKFVEDKEIVLFSSKDELISKASFYIKNPESRKKIAFAGYERLCKSNYSLESQLKIIEKFAFGKVI